MSNDKKITIYIDALPLSTERTSGIGHTLASTVQALTRNETVRANYNIVLFGPPHSADRVMQWGHENVTYASLGGRQKITTLLNLAGLLPPIDKRLGTGIYVFGNFMNYPLSQHSKSITYIHDVVFDRHPEFVKPKVRTILRRYVKKWIDRSDVVVTVSEHAKKEIRHFYSISESKVQVIPNGINFDDFYRRSPSEIAAVKKKYGIKGEYIFYLGNIEPRKNLQRLIQAYWSLSSDLRNQYGLLIVGGDSWLSEDINQTMQDARKNGCNIIRPSEYVADEDLPALYSGAVLLAHPAVYEGFGIPPLQAMACGTPVLVADSASLPEVVGEAGFYVNPLQIESIANGMTDVLNSPKKRRTLIDKGLRQARRYTWDSSAARLVSVVETLSQEKRSRL